MQSTSILARIDKFKFLDAIIIGSLALFSILIRIISITAFPQTINEFDSWYLFYNALLIVKAGGNWYAVPPDVHAWFPWGYFIELENTIGLPFLVALFSVPFYSIFGQNIVYTLTLVSPIVLDGIGVVAAFLAVESITNSRVGGYIAAAITAFTPSLTYKNILGSLPKTSWGGVFVLFTIYFLSLAIKKKKPLYGIPAGIMIFLANITWGGYTYIDISLAIAAFLIVLFNKNDEISAKTLTISGITAAFLTSLSPNTIGFMSEVAHGLALLIIPLFLYLDLYLRRVLPKDIVDSKNIVIGAAIILLVSLVVLGSVAFKVQLIPSRYYAIINPFFQFTVPIDRTVAEYIPQSIAAMIQDFGIGLFLSIIGIYFLLTRKQDMAGIWLVVLGAASIYGTSEQPYLFNYTIYIVAALAGVAVAELFSRFMERKIRIAPILMLTLIGVALLADAGIAVEASYAPQALINSSTSYLTTNYAWISALDWINQNTPNNAFILSWWDYGYWIHAVGNRTVIDENNTLNGTQIKLMAEMFLNNESFAVNVLENDFHLYPYGNPNYTRPVYIVAYDAVTEYIVNNQYPVWFIGYPTNFPGTFIGYTTSLGDIAKAIGAMTTIAGYNTNSYVNTTYINETASYAAQYNSQLASIIANSLPMAWTPKTYNSLIGSMFIEAIQSLNQGPVQAPFSISLSQLLQSSSTSLYNPNALLPRVNLMYFKPVYIALFPLSVTNALGGEAIVYIMVYIYQFVMPNVIIPPTISTA
ncbi:STT3 domain-containing protein [Sulfolobus acidocaldarius]|uniref:dolichyl-phosphooligosaccharide-protein glycotransferase n=1 Tax=Sulfolobus acidocaldarius TaxID=2285 RepID=A0A0U3GEG4_9CREN|nr:STT3 domain-containing protein [Sulfolobus acidocaldarius]ALU28533.1 peptide transporter [Sulfolobus acidocaldarius]